MVKVRKSLIGEKFGKLTVLKQAEDYIYPNGNRLNRWECLCECGNINHNTYDNRRGNLRIVTRSQNNMNRNSKGVCYDSARNRYIAYLKVNYEPKFFGHFKSENEAIEARKFAEQKYFGEFSYTNSVNDTTTGEL